MKLLDFDQRRLEMAEQGFTIFESLFSIAEMDQLDEHLAEYEARLNRERLDSREVVFTQKVAERDENIQRFAQRPEFVQISTEFLGPDTDLYFNQKVYKNPHGTNSFSWHQDDAYGPVEPAPYLTLWIAINDATIENGCISVLPGSHKRGLVEHWQGSFGLACHSLDDADNAQEWSQSFIGSTKSDGVSIRSYWFAPQKLGHEYQVSHLYSARCKICLRSILLNGCTRTTGRKMVRAFAVNADFGCNWLTCTENERLPWVTSGR
jgi:ectoine hydroxylase-related dioxygenase (phytanoyl-CoA dioxygenase family)